MKRLFGAQAILLGMMCYPSAASSDTVLQRVLSLVKANPSLVNGRVFVNVARQQAGDGVSVFAVNGSAMIYRGATSEDATGEDESSQKLVYEQIDTTAMGTNNVGSIDSVLMHPSASDPGTVNWIFSANAAATQTPVLAPVTLYGDATPSADAPISTSAIGAMNTGNTNVVVIGDSVR